MLRLLSVLLLCAWSLCATAFALVGETRAELVARFKSEPIAEMKHDQTIVLLYQDGPLLIRITLADGIVVAESYHGCDEKIAHTILEQLKFKVEESKKKEGTTVWDHPDVRLVAALYEKWDARVRLEEARDAGELRFRKIMAGYVSKPMLTIASEDYLQSREEKQ